MDRARSSFRVLTVAIVMTTVAMACRDAGGVREGAQSESAQQTALLDDEAVKEMASPDTIGRIIYEPPPDLSLESARLRRPDIVKPDTSRRAAATGPTARRDTTGGDATADTSGGAARPQPRPRAP